MISPLPAGPAATPTEAQLREQLLLAQRLRKTPSGLINGPTPQNISDSPPVEVK